MSPFADERKLNIVQGEYKVSDDPSVVITTLLGSCVAACIFDPAVEVGGMNHFLLPGRDAVGSTSEAERYGVHLMELLVNGLLKQGASRNRLQAKLFGGAKMMQTLKDIGSANARFAREFLDREGISVVGGSTGGDVGRRLQYWPTTGRARQMFMTKDESIPEIKSFALSHNPNVGDLELF
jgi:chemotaxis protein CheD